MKTTIRLVLAAGIVLAVCTVAYAAKGGGGGDCGGGKIYVRLGGLSTMDCDGSNRTSLPAGILGEPSQALHGGHRWMLQGRGIPGEFYPNGEPREELFAVRDDGNEGFTVQLTDQPSLDPCGLFDCSFRWTVDAQGQPDGKISFIGGRWDLGTGEILEGGIYQAEILFDGAGDVIGLASQPQAPAASLPLVELDGSLRPDAIEHDYDPTGTEAVYNTTTKDIYIVVIGGAETFLTGNGWDPRWSPSGEYIAFFRDDQPDYCAGYSIYRIGSDGTNEVRLVAGGVKASAWHPRWSPTGTHLAYSWSTTSVRLGCPDNDNVFRVGADGKGKTELTTDDISWAWHWR